MAIAILILAFDLFVSAMNILILMRVIFSWIRTEKMPRFQSFIAEATEPALGLVRKFVPPVGMLDFTPIIALLLLSGFQWLVHLIIGIPYTIFAFF